MGYDLHVTRASHWTDSESAPITDVEWRSFVAAADDLELTGAAEAVVPDGPIRYENGGLALWRGHPAREKVWFDFRNGRVVVKNPNQPTIARMISAAWRSITGPCTGSAPSRCGSMTAAS